METAAAGHAREGRRVDDRPRRHRVVAFSPHVHADARALTTERTPEIMSTLEERRGEKRKWREG